MRKVWFFNKWVLIKKLVRRLESLGFVEGKDFGEAELEYKGVPLPAQEEKK